MATHVIAKQSHDARRRSAKVQHFRQHKHRMRIRNWLCSLFFPMSTSLTSSVDRLLLSYEVHCTRSMLRGDRYPDHGSVFRLRIRWILIYQPWPQQFQTLKCRYSRYALSTIPHSTIQDQGNHRTWIGIRVPLPFHLSNLMIASPGGLEANDFSGRMIIIQSCITKPAMKLQLEPM